MMRRLLLTAAALGTIFAAPARAATNTGSLDVSANVVTSCQIAATALNFGNYDGAENDTTATITVTCNTASVNYTVDLGNGANFLGTRRMVNAGSYLGYALYSDSGRTTAWTATVGGTTSAASPSTDNSLVIFGRMPAAQLLTQAGVFTDTVLMTVTF